MDKDHNSAPPSNEDARTHWIIAFHMILKAEDLTPVQKFVGIAILAHCGPDADDSYPGNKRLSVLTGYKSLTTISAAITVLKAKGYMTNRHVNGFKRNFSFLIEREITAAVKGLRNESKSGQSTPAKPKAEPRTQPFDENNPTISLGGSAISREEPNHLNADTQPFDEGGRPFDEREPNHLNAGTQPSDADIENYTLTEKKKERSESPSGLAPPPPISDEDQKPIEDEIGSAAKPTAPDPELPSVKSEAGADGDLFGESTSSVVRQKSRIKYQIDGQTRAITLHWLRDQKGGTADPELLLKFAETEIIRFVDERPMTKAGKPMTAYGFLIGAFRYRFDEWVARQRGREDQRKEAEKAGTDGYDDPADIVDPGDINWEDYPEDERPPGWKVEPGRYG